MTSRLRSIAPAAAGVLVGALGAISASRWGLFGKTQDAHAKSAAASGVVLTTPENAWAVARANGMAARLKALSRAAAAPSAAASEGVQQDLAGANDVSRSMTPEQAGAEHVARHEGLVASVRNESLDEKWSSRASLAFTQDMDSISAAAGGLRVIDVDCRTTSCVATVEWPNFEAARKGFTEVLHGRFQNNCEREVTLPNPDDVEATLRTEIVFTKCVRNP